MMTVTATISQEQIERAMSTPGNVAAVRDEITGVLFTWQKDSRPPRAISPLPRSSISPRHLAGNRARLSMERPDEIPFTAALFIESPVDAEGDWRLGTLDSETLSRVDTSHLIELLADLSPEVSRALWDFLRLSNPGWEAVALRPGTDKPYKAAQPVLDAFIKELGRLYGAVDVVWNRLLLGGFLRGAFMAELVLDKDGRRPVDLATPDPAVARFRRANDEERGQVWQLGQLQYGRWIPLDRETVQYIPIDPLPGKPYGRSLVSPAIFTALFLIGLLHDLRRVVAQQGYPRLDLEVNMERLKAAMPADLHSDPDKVRAWVQGVIDEIETVYASLEPDDAYIHTDVVKVNRPVGTVDSSSLGAVDGLIRGLERMATRALKTMPLLMGLAEGGTETQSNREWELQNSGIKSLQHLLEQLLGNLLGIALQVQGIAADVQFRFAELRAAEMLRDAQTLAMTISNATKLYEAGHISQDESAQMTVGHPADQPEPRAARAATPPAEIVEDDGDGNERTRPLSGEQVLQIMDYFADSLRSMRYEPVNGNGHAAVRGNDGR
jgi:hypothetical protein